MRLKERPENAWWITKNVLMDAAEAEYLMDKQEGKRRAR
jgi:hypothetical protein